MLSLEKGLPIAKIIKSKTFKPKDGKSKLLGLLTDEEVEELNRIKEATPKKSPFNMLGGEDMKKKHSDVNTKLARAQLDRSTIKKENDVMGKLFEINDGELLPLPAMTNDDEGEQEANIRDVIYVAGVSNSGKSTFISQFLKMYKEIYPDNPVFIFSAVPTDKAFKWLEELDEKHIKKLKNDEEYERQFVRIPLDESFKEMLDDGDEWTVDDLFHSAVIFDDIDVIQDRQIRDAVRKLRGQCLQIGRHNAITTICTSHMICDRERTKLLLCESTKIVLFPRSGDENSISYCLKQYCGFTKEQITNFLNIPSRWCMVNKTYPKYVMGKNTCYLLK